MRRVPGGALNFWKGMDEFARAANLAATARIGNRVDVRGNFRSAGVFRLLPTALEPLGHVYADAGSRLGDRARLLGAA